MPGAVGGRYILYELLGTGSSGTVYRAVDRLTGCPVALKRVNLPDVHPGPGASADTLQADALRLTLANEFQILASLRHPNIIGVLDYGFDDELQQRQPYFTMEYLAGAGTVLQAGAGRPVVVQVGLIIQILQALDYLHRRGIVHRDLKPGNVLVVSSGRDGHDGEETVKVLDLGLSVACGQAGIAGTLGYMAPEVLTGRPAGEAADLYAVGVIAYELFAGRHPFDTTDAGRLIVSALQAVPDLSALRVEPAVAQVVGRLLDRDPARRYASAESCIAALSQAMGQSVPGETVAIREGFLQAAHFVGREEELGRLVGALREAMAGRGSTWLIGGESGVGKSRLLDELRTRALVAGARVVRGQAPREGGIAYQLWHEPLRRLVLSADVDEHQAGILRAVVSDVEALLGRSVAHVPDLAGDAGRRRLLKAITDILVSQPVPTLLLLEDLQWAGHSLEVLAQVAMAMPGCPLLVVGSYRDDEAAELPAAVPNAQSIKLRRLSEAEVAELSASMLGQAGRQYQVVDLLRRESEGNTFFMIEVARALAEEAGRLSEIGQMTLPMRVFPRGIQTVVQRRLARVPAEAQGLLRLAAVAGRGLDLRVLARPGAGHAVNLESWLTTCANAAVLELQDGRWRFAHDKLRDGLLAALGYDERVALHRQVAEATEQAYPGSLAVAARLAHHWSEAGDVDRQRHYARLAGEYAASQFVNAEAVSYLGLALELTPEQESRERYTLLLAREQVYDLLGQRQAQQQDLEVLHRLGGLLGSSEQAAVALREANHAFVTGSYSRAAAAAQAAIELAGQAGDRGAAAAGYLWWGRALWRQGDYCMAQPLVERALAGAQSAGRHEVEADSLQTLGILCAEQGDYAGSLAYGKQALAVFCDLGDRRGEGTALNNLGVLCRDGLDDYAGARTWLEQALPVRREIGDRRGEGYTLLNLGEVCCMLGHYAQAGEYYGQVLRIAPEVGDRLMAANALDSLSLVWRSQGDYGQALARAEEALDQLRPLGARLHEAVALDNLACVYRELGAYARAQACYEQVLVLARDVGEPLTEGLALAHLGLACLSAGEAERALSLLEQSLGLARDLQGRWAEGLALTGLGEALLCLGRPEEAAEANRQAARTWVALGLTHREMEPLAGLARACLASTGDGAAQSDGACLQQARDHVVRILAYLDGGGSLAGIDSPARVYLGCYQVLRAAGDARAVELLEAARALVRRRAETIPDESLKRSFMHDVPEHRLILGSSGDGPLTDASRTHP